MGIVGLDGRTPIVSEGPTGRKIVIHEAVVKGQLAWGVEFEGLGLLEAFQVLGEVIRGTAQRERSLATEKRALTQVQQKMNQINEKEKENE